MYKLFSAVILILAGWLMFSGCANISCRGCRRRQIRKAVKLWICLAVILLAAGYAFALELPDTVNEWRCVKEDIVPLILDANGENLGRIVYRDYARENPKGTLQIILTEGIGTGSLYVPERVRDSKGAMPSDSYYKILDIDGLKSILERHEFMPVSIAVNAAKNTVITIESSSLSEESIIEFARNLISKY